MSKLTWADQIICADSPGVLKSMDSDSVDLIIGSPPYGVQRKYGELNFNLKGQG